MMKISFALATLQLVAMSSACGSNQPIDVGSRDAGLPDGPNDDPEACRNGTQLPIVGIWDGYIENFALPSRSDLLRLTITSATARQVCGKVRLGTNTPAGPPTDPNVGYPPGKAISMSSSFQMHAIELAQGFPMTMREATANSTRMRFTAGWHEYWHAWCDLQTPFLLAVDSSEKPVYSCLTPLVSSDGANCYVGNSSGPDGGGDLRPVDCDKAALCGQLVCQCNENRCTGSPNADFTFDLRINGNEAAGSVKIGTLDVEFHNVYLTQVK